MSTDDDRPRCSFCRTEAATAEGRCDLCRAMLAVLLDDAAPWPPGIYCNACGRPLYGDDAAFAHVEFTVVPYQGGRIRLLTVLCDGRVCDPPRRPPLRA